MTAIIKPLIKWVGGKRQLLSQIQPLLPKKFNNYFEPFVGGGAVFFDIQKENSNLSDINSELVNLYNVVKSQPQELIKFLETLKYEKELFLEIRAWDREKDYLTKYSDIKRAGRFMFMNRTGFNGLYRVNSQGLFNVPFGKYKNPDFVQKENIMNVSKLLNDKNISINNYEYDKILEKVNKGDFVYLDPPYDVLENAKSFTAYNNSGFGRKEQEELANFCKTLDKKGVYFMLSNHDTDFIKDLYSNFNINIVKARRNINSKGGSRGVINEVVIINY